MAETVKGLADVLKKLDALGKNLDNEIDEITFGNAQEIERNAKRFAPVDTGKLRQSIAAYKAISEKRRISYDIGANTTGLAPYAPYMEFGTGGLVDVPAELQEIAARFRGRGIRQVNLRPRPYLYPAFQNQKRQYLADLNVLLDQELGKI